MKLVNVAGYALTLAGESLTMIGVVAEHMMLIPGLAIGLAGICLVFAEEKSAPGGPRT